MKTFIKDRLKYWKYSSSLADDSFVSDIYIVEFPKSGITWLSTLIANYALLLSDMNDHVTFYNVSQYVPDIHTTKKIGPKLYHSPSPRFVKSHAEFNPYYVHVAYLVRHPLNVMKSYYRFLGENSVNFSSFEEFVVNPVYGARAWKRHIRSWFVESGQRNHLHLLRYEDLRNDTFESLSCLLYNLGIQLDQEVLIKAIERSSLEHMKKSEEIYKNHNPKYKISFVGNGNVDLDEENSALAIIREICKDEMLIVGYDD